MSDYIFAFLFLLVYEVLSWPLRLALQPIPMSGDIRRMISRVAGPLIVCMIAWALGNVHVPIGPLSSWIYFALCMAGAWGLCQAQGHKVDWKALVSPISDRRAWKREAFLEVFALAIFFSFLWFRRWVPEMTTTSLNGAGSEKFDNSQFFWSCWHSVTLPPEDYWLAGQSLPYYYFGHFFWAWIGRTGFFPGEWVVTLGLSRLVMLTWESSYLLIRAFGARAVSAAIGAFFVTWGGNPHAIQTWLDQYDRVSGRQFEALTKRDWRFAPRYRKKVADAGGTKPVDYMYWDPAHGVIPGTITEYPAWTAILGDFHAHHMSLPWNLGLVALVLAGDRWLKLRRKLLELPKPPKQKPAKKEKKKGKGKNEAEQIVEPPPEPPAEPPQPVFLRGVIRYGIFFACFLSMGIASTISNLWVGPLIGVSALGILLWRDGWGPLGFALRFSSYCALFVLMVVGVWVTMGTLENPVTKDRSAELAQAKHAPSLVERLSAKSPVKFLPHDIRSTTGQILSHWGYQLGALAVGIGFFLSLRARGLSGGDGWTPIAACGSLAVIAILLKLTMLRNEPILLWIAVTALVASLGFSSKPWLKPMPLAFICLTTFLLGGLELFFIDDPMAGALERYNTYFKLCFPAWGLMTAGAWMCVHRVWHVRLPLAARIPLRLLMLGWIVPVMAMVYFGVPARLDSTMMHDIAPRKPTLNAYSWLENTRAWQDGYVYSSEKLMLDWIRENIPPGDRVAEAVCFASPPTGMSRSPQDMRTNINYAYVGRVASLGGHPVPLGWEGHEYTWRTGETAKPVAENMKALRAIFYARTPREMIAAAKAFKTRWIVFGKSERDILNDPKSGTNAEAVFQVVRQAADPYFIWPPDAQYPDVYVFKSKK